MRAPYTQHVKTRCRNVSEKRHIRRLNALVAAVAARRARSLAPAARRRLCRRRPSPGCGRRGAPPAPCSRVSPPSGPAPRRSRSASPGASRCSAWGGPAVPGPRCGGARRSGGRGWAFGGRCGGRLCGALRPPAWGWGSAAAAADPARRCGCSSPAVRRASQCLPRSAYGAMLFKEKLSCKTSREAQHVVPVYCSTYKISCEFGKTRIILPNSIQKSNIPLGDIILNVELAKIPVLPNRGDCLLPARFFPAYHAQRETSTKSCRYAPA